ncbi:MAG: type I polyketide synthase, partial [Anaerolineae bacterium]|nr:type I polyketide synthase [Anaerolineae bacterium]
AGIAGLIKVVLSLQHRQIPPHLHFEQPNPYIPWDEFPLRVPTEALTWSTPSGRRLAGVSSFGFSGTNAHLVVEAYQGQGAGDGQPQVIVLSARTEERLRAYADKLLTFVTEQPDISLANVAYTLQVGRAAMDERLALVATDLADLQARLTHFLANGENGEYLYRGHLTTNQGWRDFLVDGAEAQEIVASLV